MRKEHDFLGELEIPDNAYYGVQTMRAMENFQITGYTADPLFIKALGMVKKAAALANMKIGLLDEKIGNAMVQACDDIISGKLNSRIFFQSEPEVISTVRALRRVTVLLMPAPSYTLTE